MYLTLLVRDVCCLNSPSATEQCPPVELCRISLRVSPIRYFKLCQAWDVGLDDCGEWRKQEL